MVELNEELSVFARSIVYGDVPSQRIDNAYQNYPLVTAMEIYRNNYRGNLHDALEGAYPVIQQLVGKDFFRRLTKSYIGKHPSNSGNLYHYGERMADFVSTFAPAQSLPYLSDVAALEWACHCAYFAADAGKLDIGTLSQILPAQYSELFFFTHPACHVVHSEYPLVEIWNAHQPGANSDFIIDLNCGRSQALVSRMDDVVQVAELGEAEACWLLKIQGGTALGKATAETLEIYPEFDLQVTLLNLISSGVLTDFESGGNS